MFLGSNFHSGVLRTFVCHLIKIEVTNMNNSSKKGSKDASAKNTKAGNGRKTPLWKNYGNFVVNQAIYGRSQVDRLWEEIIGMQHAISKLQVENNELKAASKVVA